MTACGSGGGGGGKVRQEREGGGAGGVRGAAALMAERQWLLQLLWMGLRVSHCWAAQNVR
jgi:hypothetical protein